MDREELKFMRRGCKSGKTKIYFCKYGWSRMGNVWYDKMKCILNTYNEKIIASKGNKSKY